MLFCKIQDLLEDWLLYVKFNDNTVRPTEDLVPVLVQHFPDRRQIRPSGNRRDHVPVVVKDRQPGAQPLRPAGDIADLHLMADQISDDIIAEARLIHHAQKGGPQFHIGDILHHIAAYAAVHLHHAPHIPASRDILREGISLDVHKCCSDHHNSHACLLRCSALCYSCSAVSSAVSPVSDVSAISCAAS